MPTYIGLLRYTSEGVKGIKGRWAQGNPNDRARQVAKAMGCELKGAYVTMGRYDGVAIIEAPNDETMAKLKELGFEIVLDPKTAKIVIGRLPIEKLGALAELKTVRYVAPQI